MFGRKKKTVEPTFPRLSKVLSGTQFDGYADLVIEVDTGKGVEIVPYTYVLTDDAPVARQIKAWLADNNVRLDGPPQKA